MAYCKDTPVETAEMKKGIIVFLLFLLASPVFTVDIFQGDVMGEQLRVQGLDEKGNLSWILFAVSSKRQGSLVSLKTIRLFYYLYNKDESKKEPDVIFIRSPFCRFFQLQKEVKSPSAIIMKSENAKQSLLISGIGYDIYLDKKIIHLRSTVKIVFKQTESTDGEQKKARLPF